MNSKLLSLSSLSLITMNYLALNAINGNLPSASELTDEQPYAALVIDQVDYWIQEVDNLIDEEPEILTILRQDIETELIEGNYIEHGVEIFIERVREYFLERINGAYAKMLIDIAKEMNTEKSLPK